MAKQIRIKQYIEATKDERPKRTIQHHVRNNNLEALPGVTGIELIEGAARGFYLLTVTEDIVNQSEKE